jgi:hypothetical protein
LRNSMIVSRWFSADYDGGAGEGKRPARLTQKVLILSSSKDEGSQALSV